MQTFTGFEYICIDIANQFGLDKELFETRIQWVYDHIDELETLYHQAETKPLYIKAVMALREAQKGIPTGHLVGFDASCSGIQIMSAITGCYAGASATGLVDPNKRSDAYSDLTNEMNKILGGNIEISRKDAKQALMTAFYGSKLTPKSLFGEDTPELAAFNKAAMNIAPGPWTLLEALLDSWQPYAKEHSWIMPDGFDVRIKVMDKMKTRIEVDELDHSTFTYEYYENTGTKKGLSNAANMVHSIDAYVVRNIHRRCNYDKDMVLQAKSVIDSAILHHTLGIANTTPDNKIQHYIDLFTNAGIVDPVILPYLTPENVESISLDMLKELEFLVDTMLSYEPFEVVTIHDEFKCHPNNMNHLRNQYIQILAQLADSDIATNILRQIHKINEGVFKKSSADLSEYILNSNYALT